MGYFSNATEGDLYESRWCASCVHEDPEEGCPVMNAHALFNYDQGRGYALDCVLNMLIPRHKDGCSNIKCAMHHPRDEQ